MRKKTSLTLDERSIPLARDRARAEGIDIGRWIDQAIRNEAARDDAELLEEWYASMSPEEKAITAALEAADRAEEVRLGEELSRDGLAA